MVRSQRISLIISTASVVFASSKKRTVWSPATFLWFSFALFRAFSTFLLMSSFDVPPCTWNLRKRQEIRTKKYGMSSLSLDHSYMAISQFEIKSFYLHEYHILYICTCWYLQVTHKFDQSRFATTGFTHYYYWNSASEEEIVVTFPLIFFCKFLSWTKAFAAYTNRCCKHLILIPPESHVYC